MRASSCQLSMAASKLLNSILAMAIILALFSHPSSCSARRRLEEDDDELPIRAQYEQWIQRYSRTYKDEHDKTRRYKVYRANARLIDSFNTVSDRYKLEDNQFADLTNWEFRDLYTCLRGCTPNQYKGERRKLTPKRDHNRPREDTSQAPPSVDWRTDGAVTAIKDQGQCGSCWAFSAVAAIEGIAQISSGELVPMSEQEILDCDDTGGDNGCQGGSMAGAFEFVKKNGGITTEEDYPYQGTKGACNTSMLHRPIATVAGYTNVTANSEEGLLKATASQPVSVAVDAGGMAWQFYSQGIYAGPCGTNLNHGVTVVGYGSEGVDKYWIVKNSWGVKWGEEGYIRIKRDVPFVEGMCGIAMEASYPQYDFVEYDGYRMSKHA